MLDHARHLDDAAQLHLAPASARGGLAQRLHELRGLGVQHRQVRLDEPAELLVQRRVRAFALELELAELAVDLRERVGERLHERVDGVAPRLEIAVRALLELLEPPAARSRKLRLCRA